MCPRDVAARQAARINKDGGQIGENFTVWTVFVPSAYVFKLEEWPGAQTVSQRRNFCDDGVLTKERFYWLTMIQRS